VIYEPYDEIVEFITPTGNFFVRVLATVKELVVALPEMLDFNFVAVNEVAEREIEIHNIGELDAKFEWRLTGPFRLSPMKGSIPPDGFVTINLRFHPLEANVFVARAMLDVQDTSEKQKLTREFRCSAISKFPHLVTAEHVMNFGDVLTDQKVEKTFYLKNDSLVPAIFKITPTETDVDPVFFFTPTHGTIAPEEDMLIKIRYTAKSSDTFSASNFTITTAGGNVLPMRCTGQAVGPLVSLSQTSVNFGDILLGPTKVDGTRDPPTYSRSFQIINASDQPTEFTFVAAAEGMFGFNMTSGIIPAHLYVNIIVSFTPTYHAFNFYKRVTCLIKNQGSLYLDLLCTCVDPDDKRRPAQLTMKHVKQYHNFLRAGITRVPEADLESVVDFIEKNPGATPQFPGYRRPLHPQSHIVHDAPNYHQQMHAFFLAQEDPKRDVGLDTSILDFGGLLAGSGETREIIVYNRLGSKILCLWCNGRIDPSKPSDHTPAFTVAPEMSDISAGGSATFTVTFRPSVSNEYFLDTLECVTLVKTTRTFRLVNERTFCAPLSLMLNVTGHTVPPHAEHFIPKCTFSKERINFPGVLVGGTRYQTIKLSNSATTPLQFSFIPDKSGVYAFKPEMGTVRPKEFVLISVRFTPRSARLYSNIQKVRLNFAHTQELELIGTGYHPTLSFGHDEEGFYLRPTCIGTISDKVLEVKNSSRIAVHYKWYVPDRLKEVLVIDYPDLIVQPNDTQIVKWTFAPKKAKLYHETIQCEFLPALSEITGERQELTGMVPEIKNLDVIGDGALSGVSFECDNLNFGAVLVNNTVQHEFFLINKSTSSITYALAFEQTLKMNITDDDNGEQQLDLVPMTYDLPTGYLRARSRKKIVATFAPTLRRFYSFTTMCFAVPDPVPRQGDPSFVALLPSLERPRGPLLCELPMSGVSTYPAIAFADVQRMGLNPYRLWKELQLDAINAALASEPGDFESDLNRKEGLVGGGGYTGIIDALSVFDMHFPPMVRKSPPMTMTFKLENQGHLPVEWSLTFPTEKQVEVELWAEAEEPGPRELRWMDIVTKKLFAVEPRKGALKPGEMQVLKISYSYTHLGEPWELPVILQAKKGRRVVLNLIGRTLDNPMKCLHFAHKPFGEGQHMLQAVMLGEKQPQVQTMDLFNSGVTPLEYEIDTKACDEVQANNYGFRIFECENPRGGIPPGGYVKVRWIFNPIEAKLYEIRVPVTVITKGSPDKYNLTLRGQGFHPQMMIGSETQFRNHISTYPRLPGFHWFWQTTLGSKTDRLRLDKQIANLNPDFISFGQVPLHSITHRLVMVRNFTGEPVTFNWDSTSQLLQEDGGFTIAPLSGRLDAYEHVVCKITYYPVLRPELVESEIVCLVQPEQPPEEEEENMVEDEEKKARDAQAAQGKAAAELKSGGHQTLMERQQYAETRDGVACLATRNLPPGFEDDAAGLTVQMANIPHGLDGGSSSKHAGSQKHAASLKGSLKEGSLKKGKTGKSLTMASGGNDNALQPILEDDSKYRLFVNLQASAMTPNSYRALHPKYSQFMILKQTEPYANLTTRMPAGYGASAAPSVIKSAMISIIKEVILDMDVKHSFSEVEHQPIPYFCQFSTAPPVPSTVRAAALLERLSHNPVESHVPETKTALVPVENDGNDVPSIQEDNSEDNAQAQLKRAVESESLESLTAASREAMAIVKAKALLARHEKLAKDQLEADALRKMHRDEDFYFLINKIVENTICNLAMEASFKEFDPTRPPRQIAEIVGRQADPMRGTVELSP